MTVKELTYESVGVLLSARKDFPDGWNDNMIKSAFDGGRFFGYLAEENHSPVGFITATEGLDGEFDIESVYTFPEYRRRGVAKMLLNKVLLKPHTKIFLEVRESNSVAIKVYEKAGFKKISVRKKYYPDGENALIYIKENEA